MKKAQALFLLLCIFVIFAVPIFAQTEDENGDDYFDGDTDWYGELPPLYSQGDKTFNISLGLIFPTLFIQQKEL